MAIDKITLQATDNLFVNTEITGTEAAKMPVGTTAERANAQSGDLRFNSTNSLMEYYDGTGWKSIDSPPVISSISPTVESDANANITITGSFFATGATVKFVGNDGTEYASPSVTRNSSTEIVATTPATALSVANEPYDVVVTNVSGLNGTLADALDAGGVPAFTESAGSLGTVYDVARTGLSFDAGAVDPDGDTITYSVSVGALPSGLSLNTSTGEISGNADAVGSDTTTTFTISAATASDTSTRQFSITIAAPVITSYTSTGSGTFSVPSGVAAVDVLVVAGGGSGGSAGGGGSGGLIYRPAFPVTPGGSVAYTIGTGGGGLGNKQSPAIEPSNWGNNGQNSVFGTLTAIGGGGGGAYSGSDIPAPQRNCSGRPGGSGGGGGNQHTQTSGGVGTQPQQPGDSSTYGFGNPGGDGHPSTGYVSGGGGGAGAAGGQYHQNSYAPIGKSGGDGGIGKAYNISGTSYYYAGGGGGGAQAPGGGTGGGGPGGQGGGGGGTVWDSTGGSYLGAGAPMYNGNTGQDGTNNNQTQGTPQNGGQGGNSWADGGDAADNSGGGGGGMGISVTYGGAGGSGIVIVKY